MLAVVATFLQESGIHPLHPEIGRYMMKLFRIMMLYAAKFQDFYFSLIDTIIARTGGLAVTQMEQLAHLPFESNRLAFLLQPLMMLLRVRWFVVMQLGYNNPLYVIALSHIAFPVILSRRSHRLLSSLATRGDRNPKHWWGCWEGAAAGRRYQRHQPACRLCGANRRLDILRGKSLWF